MDSDSQTTKAPPGSLHPACSAALLEIIKTCEGFQNLPEGMELDEECDEAYRALCRVISIASGRLAEIKAQQNAKAD